MASVENLVQCRSVARGSGSVGAASSDNIVRNVSAAWAYSPRNYSSRSADAICSSSSNVTVEPICSWSPCRIWRNWPIIRVDWLDGSPSPARGFRPRFPVMPLAP